MTELLTPPHQHTPVSYLNQQQSQQQQPPTGTFTGTTTEQHPVDLSNSQQRPQAQTLLNSPVSSAAFYGLPAEYGNSSSRRADTYKPNGLSLSLGIPDSGKLTHLRQLDNLISSSKPHLRLSGFFNVPTEN